MVLCILWKSGPFKSSLVQFAIFRRDTRTGQRTVWLELCWPVSMAGAAAGGCGRHARVFTSRRGAYQSLMRAVNEAHYDAGLNWAWWRTISPGASGCRVLYGAWAGWTRCCLAWRAGVRDGKQISMGPGGGRLRRKPGPWREEASGVRRAWRGLPLARKAGGRHLYFFCAPPCDSTPEGKYRPGGRTL